MSTLLMIRKSILITTFGLTSINKKLSSKYLFLLFLADTEKIETTILYIFRVVPLIFCALILVFLYFET